MFETMDLTGERVLVKGTDSLGTEGSQVLDASEWNAVKAHGSFHQASTEFDEAVEEFFAPLVEAAEKLEKAGAPSAKPDPATFVVFSEEVEGRESKAAEVHHLGHDAVVLRLLERGDHDRLVWVNDQLEVLAVIEGTESPTAVDTVAEVLGAVGSVDEDDTNTEG